MITYTLLTTVQQDIFRNIYAKKALSASEISKITNISKQAVLNHISRMKHNGIVETGETCHCYVLTEKGKEIAESIRGEWNRKDI